MLRLRCHLLRREKAPKHEKVHGPMSFARFEHAPCSLGSAVLSIQAYPC
jgi:hypothetical protein